MDDRPEEHGGEEAGLAHPPHLPAPWEAEDDAHEGREDQGGRARHDAFTPARRKAFLKALSKSGCILEACRTLHVSSRTIYNHQGKDAEFLRHCILAIEMAGTTVELMAWERGVTGIEHPVIRGGKVVGTTLKRSDSILRLLLQGANRKKYGPRPGFSRKRLLAHERKQIEREVQAKVAASRRTLDQVRESIARKVEAIQRHAEPERLAAGWTKTEDGDWIPPGWVYRGTGENDDSV